MRILLAEDDPMIGRALQQGLTDAGFAVDWVTDGRSACLAAATHDYHLIVLDLGLPRQDGMSVLRELRQSAGPPSHVPVLVVSARDTLPERIAGLNAGADDYLLKPFDLDELVARMRALLRRQAGSAQPVLRCGPLQLDTARREARLGTTVLALSAREFSLLEALMQQPGTVLSRDQLESALYGWEHEIGSNAIEVHLHHLRRKLGRDTIRNVRGVGYQLVTPPPQDVSP